MTLPSNRIRPPVGLYSCSRVRPTVVLPQPDSPTRPRVSPGRIANETLSTALSGGVLAKPVRTGKYSFQCSTCTRYSLLGILLPLLRILDIHPAGCAVAFADHQFGRLLTQADLHGEIAPRAERAALGQVQHVDRGAADRHKPLLHVGTRTDGAQQALGVFMRGAVEDVVGGAALAHTAAVHDDDLIAHG